MGQKKNRKNIIDAVKHKRNNLQKSFRIFVFL